MLSVSELRRLAQAESRWAARGFSDYSVEMRRSCFCAPETTEWTRLDVVGGTLVRATVLGSGVVIEDSRLQAWRTVEQVFEEIRAANRSGEWLADLEASYDPVLGFPTEVSFVSKPDILDAGLLYSLRNARPTP